MSGICSRSGADTLVCAARSRAAFPSRETLQHWGKGRPRGRQRTRGACPTMAPSAFLHLPHLRAPCGLAFRAAARRASATRHRAASSGRSGWRHQAYREYLAIAPESLQARSNLGAALARAGRYDEAIAEYNTGLQKSPDNPALLMNLGLAYYKTGRHAEAAARFERAVSLCAAVQGASHAFARQPVTTTWADTRKLWRFWRRLKRTRRATPDSTISTARLSSAMDRQRRRRRHRTASSAMAIPPRPTCCVAPWS